MSIAAFPDGILPLLKAPGGGNDTDLEPVAEGLRCVQTGQLYPFIEGIASLYQPSAGEAAEVATKVRSFYEENPFPSYEGLEEFGELVSKGYENPFSAELLKAIGCNKRILECGCGTGQLSHFLQLNNNQVLGVDLSLSSLGLAVEHKRRNGLARSSFAQMNLFELAVKDAAFDVVIAHGVLHHTHDAREAFSRIVRKVRPGGIVMVGLYNFYARIATWLRSKIIPVLGPKVDFVARTRIRDERKARVWINDQYHNPHESWHSLDEVLGWFADNDVSFLNCSPPILGTAGETAPGLFSACEPGTAYQRVVTQLSWLGSIAREGSLFDVIGRRDG